MAKLDLTLNKFTVPGIGNYEAEFGTKLPNGIPMSTTEAQNDIAMPFRTQRPVMIVETSDTTKVDCDRRLCFQSSGISLTLGKPAAPGLKVEVATGFKEGGSADVIFPTSEGNSVKIAMASNSSLVLIATSDLFWRVFTTEKESLVINTMTEKMNYSRYLYPATLPIVRFNGDTDYIVHNDLEHPKDKLYIRPGTSIPLFVENVGRLIWYTDKKVEIGLDAHDDTFTTFEPGKDYYLYLVYSPQLFPLNNNNLGFKLSLNDPEGISIYGNSDIAGVGIHKIKPYPEVKEVTITEGNAICVGGFHTVCYTCDVLDGTMTHPFTGFEAGNIHPYSVWDIWHRPQGHTAGYTYVPTVNKWASIYLLADRASCKTSEWGVYGGSYPVNNQILISTFNKPYATGGSVKKFHPAKGEQILSFQKQRFPNDQEFVALSLGSPQGVNIKGSADPKSSGGHYATNSKRILSYCGCEDAAGVLWQWGQEYGYGGSASWSNNYDTNDADVGGQQYAQPNRVLFGGIWGDGVNCGSRGRDWNIGVLYLSGACGFRGVSEPLHK